MASLSESSNDSASQREPSSVEEPSSPIAAPSSPVQIIVDRAYEVQNEGALPFFAGGAMVIFILLLLVVFIVFASDDADKLRKYHLLSTLSAIGSLASNFTEGILPGNLPGPVLSCYYDPAWSNATQRGAWVYNLAEHFHSEQCTHAVFVGVQYGYQGILIPRYASESLADFRNMKSTGLSLLVSVLVPDVPKAAADPSQFAAAVFGWALEQRFDGVELDLDEGTGGRGYDALVQAVSGRMAPSPQNWILSANVYMRPSFINHVDLKQLHSDTDFLVLNTQQLSNSDHVIAAHSPLYGNHSWDHSLKEVYARTGTLSRLMPVVPFMSREFELRPSGGVPRVAAGIACRGLGARTQYHSRPGTRAFFEVCRTLEDSSWLKAWQEDEYLYMIAKELQFVVVESKESVVCKMKFVKAHRLLGVALKQLGLDAFRIPSECDTQEALFDAVVTEMRYLEPSRDEKHSWELGELRVTTVHENGKTTCLDVIR